MIGNSFGDMLDENQIYLIFSTIKRLAEKSLRELKLKGSFVNSALVSDLPTMPYLEGLQLIPRQSRIVVEQLLTEVVVDFANRCPVLIKPRILRYPHLLGDIAITPDWRLHCQTEYAQ